MPLTADELKIWQEREMLSIEDAAFLMFGIEPFQFREIENLEDDNSASHAISKYFEKHGADLTFVEKVTTPAWINGFYSRSGIDDVASLCETIEDAIFCEAIEVVTIAAGANHGSLDWHKTLIKKQSFIHWVKEIKPELAVSMSDHRTRSPEDASCDSRIEQAREARAAHNLNKERGCRRLILEHWDAIERNHGPRANARLAKKYIDTKRTVDDPDDKLKTYQNQLSNLRKENLIP